ncbi:MAG: glycine cleavage system aminomethyltransferase GcvT [Candidatus Binatia bacterium]
MSVAVTGGPRETQRTPLFAAHRRLGARMVDFAGWEMPVYYTSILEEHRAVRARAGLFDVSHMGEVEVLGAGALGAVQRLVTNDAAKLSPGAAQYAVMCLPSGGIVDDVVYYCLAPDRFLFCVNASNVDKDFRWMRDNARGAEVVNRSAEFAQLALQGPRAAAILAPLASIDLGALRSFRVAEASVAGVSALVSRTGYTGEDGFEIYLAPEHAEATWDRLLDAGRPQGLVPVGLGARDTLRLEKGLMLYGNDIDETTSPLEAGLGWVVKLHKGDFIGRDALLAQERQAPRRRLAALRMGESAPPPRHAYRVTQGGRLVGAITSGTKSPTLGFGIGLALVEAQAAVIGSRLAVEIRTRQHPAEVVPLPFVGGQK